VSLYINFHSFFSDGDCRSLSNGIEKENKQDPLNLSAYSLRKASKERVNIVIFFLFFFVFSNFQQTLQHDHHHNEHCWKRTFPSNSIHFIVITWIVFFKKIITIIRRILCIELYEKKPNTISVNAISGLKTLVFPITKHVSQTHVMENWIGEIIIEIPIFWAWK
jgi:hypothetical protein